MYNKKQYIVLSRKTLLKYKKIDNNCIISSQSKYLILQMNIKHITIFSILDKNNYILNKKYNIVRLDFETVNMYRLKYNTKINTLIIECDSKYTNFDHLKKVKLFNSIYDQFKNKQNV